MSWCTPRCHAAGCLSQKNPKGLNNTPFACHPIPIIIISPILERFDINSLGALNAPFSLEIVYGYLSFTHTYSHWMVCIPLLDKEKVVSEGTVLWSIISSNSLDIKVHGKVCVMIDFSKFLLRWFILLNSNSKWKIQCTSSYFLRFKDSNF